LLFDDFSFWGIEITEGVQCFDTSKGLAGCPNNSLPLVTQKHATARIYLRFSGNGTSKAGIPVRLHLFANGQEYIVNTSGTARKTLNQLLTDNANVWFNANFTNDVIVSYRHACRRIPEAPHLRRHGLADALSPVRVRRQPVRRRLGGQLRRRRVARGCLAGQARRH
jgi:hypothetical protein